MYFRELSGNGRIWVVSYPDGKIVLSVTSIRFGNGRIWTVFCPARETVFSVDGSRVGNGNRIRGYAPVPGIGGK